MPTIALEGTGSTIQFGSSNYSSDLISLTLPEISREAIDTSHLGTVNAKTSKPAKLRNVGEIQAEFDHDPAQLDLTKRDAEQITISYPLLAGQATPTRLVFNGFVTSQGGEEMKIDDRMRTKVTIKVNGDLTVVAAT